MSPSEEAWLAWQRCEKAFIKECWDSFHKSGWRAEAMEEGVLKKIAQWQMQNPAPLIEPAKDAKKLRSAAEVIEEANLAKKSAEASKLADGVRAMEKLRMGRNIRRGTEGVTTLSTVVVGGASLGTGALAMLAAKAAFRMWVEDKLIDHAINFTDSALQAIAQATMPNTRAEAESLYAHYVKSCHHRVLSKGEIVIIDEKPKQKEIWFAEKYGVRWDALSR